MATEVGIKELLEAGVHFGHQTRRWNPRMRRYIHGERDGIHIIDLLQTEQLLKQASDFAAEEARRAASSSSSAQEAGTGLGRRLGREMQMPFVNKRWLGGLLTNFNTIKDRIKAPARAAQPAGDRQARPAADQGADVDGVRAAKARVQPRRRRRHAAPADAVFIIDSRPRRSRCARRGASAADHRPRRHQLRSDPGRLRDPRATTTRSARAISSCPPVGSAIEDSAAAWRVEEEKRKAEEEKRRAEEEARRQAEEEERKKRGEEEEKRKAEEAAEEGRRGQAGRGAKQPTPPAAPAAPATPAHPQTGLAGTEAAETSERLQAQCRGGQGLRGRTGAPISDCKDALAEAGGDQEKAIDILRKKGAASAASAAAAVPRRA